MIWIIGDIHGRFDPLKRLITNIERKACSNERYSIEKLIFLGDYIDYGSSSKEVIDYIMDLKYEKVLLAGNHEDLLLQFYKKNDMFKRYGNVWFNGNSGQETIASFTSDPEVLSKIYGGSSSQDSFVPEDYQLEKKYMDFFNSLIYSHVEEIDLTDYDEGLENQKFVFIHAGINVEYDVEQQIAIKTYDDFHKYREEKGVWIENTTIWTREELEKRFPYFTLIHGHTPTNTLGSYYKKIGNYDTESGFPYLKFENPDIKVKKDNNEYNFPLDADKLISINIDTGAAYGKKLTALGLDYLAMVLSKLPVIQADVGASQRKYGDVSESFLRLDFI